MLNVILTPSYNTTSPHGGGSMAKMVSFNDDEEHIQKVLKKFWWSM